MASSIPYRCATAGTSCPSRGARNPTVVAKGNAKELSYAYAADAIMRGGSAWFAYEWVNPRFGKTVKEVRLRGTSGFRQYQGKTDRR